jgi:alkanesulfonate monooxygenase SsuD/methylene tetrahydromethanopterin reductase-like flavin-dependent oxidoreductase (luciferase family)
MERPVISFGIKTNPVHVSYPGILRVWQEADEIEEIGHAWLWDHLVPLYGDVSGPIHESWTMLAALAARTSRLRLGHLVTSNRVRPPAVLGKMAATVDVISNGRLVLGIGVGGTQQPGDNPAVREYAAYGLDLVRPGEGIARLAESCAIFRRMWTEDVFSFAGEYTTLTDCRCHPLPVQQGGPPILVGGWGDRTLRVVAEYADIWNIPGPPHNCVAMIAERSAALDAHCVALGRDPKSIVRSTQTHVHYDDPARTRAAVRELADIGVTHIVLNLPAPFPARVARWVADQVITKCTG